MPRQKKLLLRGSRPSRAAAQASKAINSTLLGTKRNIGPALANIDFNIAPACKTWQTKTVWWNRSKRYGRFPQKK